MGKRFWRLVVVLFGIGLTSSESVAAAIALYGDFNSDGELDVYISTEERTTPVSIPVPLLIHHPPAHGPILVWSAGLSSELIEELDHLTKSQRNAYYQTEHVVGIVHEGDFDGDGQLDLFIQPPTSDMSAVQWIELENGVASVRTFDNIDGKPLGADEAVIVVADKNGDGRADLTLMPMSEGMAYTALAESDGSWHKFTIVSAPSDDPDTSAFLLQVAAVPGSADVVNGAASYSVPINIVPGSAGLHPEISLEYSSATAYGFMGMGFRLDGLDTVTRCPADLLRSGAVRPVLLDSQDRICVGGNPLVLVSGSHWVDGAEYRTEAATYQKFTYHEGSGGWFSALTRDGLEKRYGYESDASMSVAGVKTRWALDRVKDRVGTYYIIEYIPDGTAERPARIAYSHNDQVPAVNGYAEVLFSYKSDAYDQTYYRLGEQFDYGFLLESIENRLNDEVVSRYILGYSRSSRTQRARLARIIQCGRDNHCAQPTEFVWTNGGGPTFDYTTNSHVSNAGVTLIRPGYSSWADVNRDGNMDFCGMQGAGAFYMSYQPVCLLGDGSGFNASWKINETYDQPNANLKWLDINNDGYTDYCRPISISGSQERIVC